MNKELTKEEILENWGIFDSNEAFNNANEAMQQYADQEKNKAIGALKNIQNILSGEPSEENAKDAYLIASDTLKLFNQQK